MRLTPMVGCHPSHRWREWPFDMSNLANVSKQDYTTLSLPLMPATAMAEGQTFSVTSTTDRSGSGSVPDKESDTGQ